MAGYTRNDTSNNIATGNVINAADLDGEFDALVAAFHASTGHTHDGTAANGAPITKIGPVQDLVISTGAITPKTDNTVDLGSSSFEFKDLYIDGTANIDALVADTADINAGTIDGTAIGANSASTGAFTTLSASSTVTLSGGTANGVLYLNGSKVATSGSALVFDGTNLGVGAAASALTTYRGAEFAGTTATTGGFLRMRTSDSSIISLDFTDSNGRAIFTTTNHPVRFGVNDSEQMRLTSTGLGIGTSSPSTKLDVRGTVNASDGTNGNVRAYVDGTAAYLQSLNQAANAYRPVLVMGSTVSFANNGVTNATLDSSGNLGLGVTPSAWYSSFKGFDISSAGAVSGSANGTILWGNAYIDGSAVEKYKTNGYAVKYVVASDVGQHIWQIAPSGTAGNTITFTQAMTLTANNNLLVGTTSERTGIRGVFRKDESSSTGGAIVLENRAVTPGRAGSLLFAAGRDVSDPSYVAGIWAETGFSGTANSADLVFGAQINGGSNPLTVTERARITSGGELCIGQTAVFGNPTMVAATGDKPGFASRHTSSGAGKYFYFGADQNNSYIVYNQAGTGVYVTDGGTSWTATSDERLKTDLAPIQNAAEKVASLRAVTGRYKTDPSDVSRAFLIAQDVQAVLPEAVNVQNDEIGTLGLAYTDTIPLLVAAIKEQQALITSLTARVALLEGN